MSIILNIVLKNAFDASQSLNILVNSSRSFADRRTDFLRIAKKLGFPERPKRPVVPYSRYVQDMCSTLESVENRKQTEIFVTIAALWKAEDASKKEVYKQAYEKDMIAYREKLDEYNREMTKEQSALMKREVEVFRENKKIESDRRERKKHALDLGKPKHPIPTYIHFANDLRKNSATIMKSAEIAAKWKALSDSERQIYRDKYSALWKQYKKDLIEWKRRMEKAGYTEFGPL